MRYPKLLLFLLLLFSFYVSSAQSPTTKNKLIALAERFLTQPASPPVTCGVSTTHQSVDELLSLATQSFDKGDPACATIAINCLLSTKKVLKPQQQVSLRLLQSLSFLSHQQYDSARVAAAWVNNQSSQRNRLTEKTLALLVLSEAAYRTRDFSNSYRYADIALQLSRATGNQLAIGKALLQMAFCARRHFTTQARRAFPYYMQAKEVAEADGDTATLVTSNVYLAADNFELEQFETGLPLMTDGVNLALQTCDPHLRYQTSICLAYCLTQVQQQDEALKLYYTALAICRQQGWPYALQNIYSFIAGVYQTQKQYDSAMHYANLTASVTGVDKYFTNSYELKAGIYRDMGDYRLATTSYQQALEWAREDFLYRNQDQLSGYEAALDTKEKELQVAEEKKRSLRLRWVIGGATLLLVMVIIAYDAQRRNRKQLAAQNGLIANQRSLLQQSLAEKEVLLKEIHHRVKNNLMVISSLLDLQAETVQNQTARSAIIEGQTRIRSIALIHQQLYRNADLGAIEFGGFATDLSRQVLSVLNKPSQVVHTHVQIRATLLDIDTAVPLGLILNELLTNSFKYAFTPEKEGHIKISLSPQGPGSYRLIYRDNGPGLPAGFDFKRSTSLGLRLIKRLSKQLSGAADYKWDDGSVFTICFQDSKTRNKEA